MLDKIKWRDILYLDEAIKPHKKKGEKDEKQQKKTGN